MCVTNFSLCSLQGMKREQQNAYRPCILMGCHFDKRVWQVIAFLQHFLVAPTHTRTVRHEERSTLRHAPNNAVPQTTVSWTLAIGNCVEEMQSFYLVSLSLFLLFYTLTSIISTAW
ncbi:hypothetical protein TRVL_02867 [Trypanosoma vivax]|nr:hypothetical protein TRVL_02867 [Trypanosoma vivax]